MAEVERTKKDLYNERLRSRNPDLNIEDEDAYYGYQGEMLDELDRYDASTRALRDNMAKNPLFAEMVAASQQEGFDPLLWAVENGRIDLDALRDDPDYAKKLGEAGKKALERRAQADAIDRAMQENMPMSVDAIRAKASELGLSDEQAQEIVGRMYQIMNDLIIGKIDPALFETIARGQSYTDDVQAAREEGVAQGLNTKVDEKLRTLPENRERPGGRQMSAGNRPPRHRNNMFLDDEEEEA